MLIKFKVQTRLKGISYKEGDTANLLLKESDIVRLVKNNIIELVEESKLTADSDEEIEVTADSVEEIEVTDVEIKEIPYNQMQAKELYEICVSKGIEVESKKKKEYYLEKLEA